MLSQRRVVIRFVFTYKNNQLVRKNPVEGNPTIEGAAVSHQKQN